LVDWFLASGLGNDSRRLCLQGFNEIFYLSEYIQSPEALNKAVQDFCLNKRAIAS
jgi:hypothetical protein